MFEIDEWLKRQDVYDQQVDYLSKDMLRVKHKQSGDWHKLKLAVEPATNYLLSQEALWLKRSSNCQPVRCHLSEGNVHYQLLIMDYLPGISLSGLLRANVKKINLHDIMLSLFKKISNLHEQGIIHNDIKPSNIIAQEQGVELIDMASSGWINQKYSSKKYQSYTLSFALPECYLRDSFQPITDWYAFFLILDLLKTGRVLPLNDTNIASFIQHQERLLYSYQFIEQVEKTLIKELNSVA